MNHQGMIEFAKSTAMEAGEILMSHFGAISSIERKSTDIDLVTIADIQSATFILNRIKATFPKHHIICEEDETEFDTDIDNDTNYYTIA